MALFMYPLPHQPAFPVFGMGDQFDGFRWLTIWNNHEHLYTVTLGHGHPEQGPWVSVTTVHKTPERRVDDDLSHGSTGYEDAWAGATIVLAEQAFPHDRRAAAAVIQHDLGSGTVDGPDDLGPDWKPFPVTIDGSERTAMWRHLGEAWSYLVDLNRVAIAVNGSADTAETALVLADQSGNLDRYQ